MNSCTYCLCRICNPVRCPRGRYHCMPCYHGTVLECPFFLHKQVTRVYRIKKRSPAIHADDLKLLRDTIDKILGSGQYDLVSQPKSYKQALVLEEQRHKAALRDIFKSFHK